LQFRKISKGFSFSLRIERKKSPRNQKDRARKEERRGRTTDRKTQNEMDKEWTRKESLFKISAKIFSFQDEA
jgi:hypothetical protein